MQPNQLLFNEKQFMDYKYKLGVDIDGVLRDITTTIMDIFKKYHPEAVKSDIVDGYDFTNVDLPLKVKMDYLFNKFPRQIFLESEPFLEAVEDFPILMKWAKQNKVKLVCASHQKSRLIRLSYLWLANWNLIFDELYFTKEKNNLPIDFLIDDSPKNYEQWTLGRSKNTFFLFDRDYNKLVDAPKRIYRLTDFIEIFEKNEDFHNKTEGTIYPSDCNHPIKDRSFYSNSSWCNKCKCYVNLSKNKN